MHTKIANHAFEQRLKEILKDKFKGYKRYGAITGGLTGSTAGGTIGLIDTIKRQNNGEFDELSPLEKAKAYITGVAAPAAVGLGLGATVGVPGGAYLKNHSVNKTLKNMRNKIEVDMVADPYFAGKAEGELKDLANRAMAHATVHHEGLDMMKVLKDTLTGSKAKTASTGSLKLAQFVQNLYIKKASIQEKGKIAAIMQDSVKPPGVSMEGALGKVPNVYSAVENKPLTTTLTEGAPKSPAPTIPGLALPKVGSCRSTGVFDSDGNEYVNGNDVELLNKLGFILAISEYSALEKTSEVYDQYSYIEKVAGIPKAVVKAIDKGDAFSGEFLKDMGFDVPKGYEMKGDLCCPIEKKAEKPGLWANIRAKKARGGKPAKPGDEAYPDKKQWDKLSKQAVAAWQRSEGKNPEGGLNAKGRASYKRETGGTLKAPVTESKPTGERASRRHSFCSRMCGMKRVNTGSKAKSDPDSRINKSLRKWNCKCGEDHSSLHEKIACVIKEAKGRCWEGYKPVKGKKPYSEDSCEPVAKEIEKEAMTLSATKNILKAFKNAGGMIQRANIPTALYRVDSNMIQLPLRAKGYSPLTDLWHEYGHSLERDTWKTAFTPRTVGSVVGTKKELPERLMHEQLANRNALNEMQQLNVPQNLQEKFIQSRVPYYTTYQAGTPISGAGHAYIENMAPRNSAEAQRYAAPFVNLLQKALPAMQAPNPELYRTVVKPMVRNLRKTNPAYDEAFRQFHHEFRNNLSRDAFGNLKQASAEKEAEYKWYKSKDLHRDVTNGRHYPLSFLTGEAKELLDAVKNRDMANFKEEIGDTSYAAQMLLAQATGLNHPVFADLSKFHAREKVWKDMFKEKGGTYHPKHMEGGSNYAKASKIIKAFQSAGIKVDQKEAERLANHYTGGKMEKEAGIPDWLRRAIRNNDKSTLSSAGKAGARAKAKNLAAKKSKDELRRMLDMGVEAAPKVVHPPSAYNVQPPLPGI